MLRSIELGREVIRNPRKYLVTIVLGIMVIALGYASLQRGNGQKLLAYPECLEDTAVTVNGRAITFREAALYVAYEENEVQQQAIVYDPDKTNRYWNLHIDGEFVRIAARNAATQMLIHDEIFYQMAAQEELELSEEERDSLENDFYDFWSDLVEDGKDEHLGVSEEDIHTAMEHMALAQKYQEIYAVIMGESTEAYDFTGEAYQELLEDNKYWINEDVWSRIKFGNITLKHKK